MPGDLDTFLEEVRDESKAAGPEAEAEFEAYLRHYELSRQLLLLRTRLGWSQPQLARRSGVQQSEISRIERGQANPTYQTLVALAGAMGMRLSFVRAEETPVKKSPKRTSAPSDVKGTKRETFRSG